MSGDSDQKRSQADIDMAEQLDEYFKQHMIVERNKRMAARVIDLLVNDPANSYFFAFGAAHFLGQDTILDIVQSAGFTVRHVNPGEPLSIHRYVPSALYKQDTYLFHKCTIHE